MVELQINEPTNVPEWLFVMFSVCTTVLVAVHIFALMISTYLLPNIDAISKLQVHELVSQSPHERMRGFIELAWAFSTVLGLFLFLVEVAILCWVKFWDYSFTAAWAATIIVIPVLIVFVAFAVHFYHSLVVYKCEATVTDLQQLEEMKKQLDDVDCSPVWRQSGQASGRLQLKCDATRWRTGGEVKRKLANGVGSQYSSHYLGTCCIQYYYCWCTHLGCQ